MPLEKVGDLRSAVGGQITIHYEPETKKLALTAASNHFGFTSKEGEALARVVGFLVVSGTGSARIFDTESFKQNHKAFEMDSTWREKYVEIPPERPTANV